MAASVLNTPRTDTCFKAVFDALFNRTMPVEPTKKPSAGFTDCELPVVFAVAAAKTPTPASMDVDGYYLFRIIQ